MTSTLDLDDSMQHFSGQSLRRRAETIFREFSKKKPKALQNLTVDEVRHALHELSVQQIELELQTEELNRSKEALINSRARYFDLYNQAPVGYFTLNEIGQITDANLTVAALLGIEQDVLIGQPISRFMVEEDSDSYYLQRKQLIKSSEPDVCELRMVMNNGSHFWARLATSAVHIRDSTPVFRVTISDITEVKNANEALRMSEKDFRSIFENATTGMVAADKTGNMRYFNEAFRAMLGYESDTLCGMHFTEFSFGDDIPGEMLLFGEILNRQRNKYRLEKRFITCDGRILWVDVYVSSQCGNDGELVGFISVVSDITERKEFALALAESRQKLRTLASHQEQLLELERKHIAREVHDEFGQLLTALKMDVSLIRLRFSDNAALMEKTEDMRVLVERTIGVVRQVASNLRPAALDFGLVPALEWLCEDFSQRGATNCRLENGGLEIALIDTQSTAVFRVVQESLTNVARHAQASEVVISLQADHCLLKVVVADNGQGFDISAIGKSSGFGLFGMRERMLALDGTLSIVSTPDLGTTVTIELPLSKGEAP
ncbi:MAG: PAS domain S-box protein [Dechloromonas sp.]|uniref:PAS domain S-box protein n=1 Tax=Candidatus Dechloromonas phosphorivorans TaxID=2899244 RepID=A0A935K461_9RHOO|nr:PAS domain S-box protein [Candidatus Dechloromonas phosphorivorans]